jgi:hypothetical protein
MGDNLDLSSRKAGHSEGSPEQVARRRDSWAAQSEASLYHSAQGSFGQSSAASSAFASAMHMEKSMARSKIQRAPLAEEDEEGGEENEGGSDGDSFFSASDDGHREEEDLRHFILIHPCTLPIPMLSLVAMLLFFLLLSSSSCC